MTEEKFVVDLYIRVSTDRQAKEGDSLEEQESELRKFCEYRQFQIHKVLLFLQNILGNRLLQRILGIIKKYWKIISHIILQE